MISNDIKTRIVLAISGNRQNYATDAKHAVALGISTSVYSEIKKGNTEQKLSDAKWMSIARRLGVSRASLYRALDALAGRGVLRREGRRVQVLQPDALEQN